MKHRLITLFALILGAVQLFGQQNPVAVNDTISASFGEVITVNLTANDHHPEGKNFVIDDIDYFTIVTDSTVLCHFSYDLFYGFGNDTLYFEYQLEDLDGNSGPESIANLVVFFQQVDNYSDTIDIGNISASVYSDGLLFWQGLQMFNNYNEEHTNHFEYPKGSGKQMAFVSGMWVGGIEQPENLRLAIELYRQSGCDYWSGPISSNNGIINIDTTDPITWHRVWKISAEEILYHLNNWQKPGYVPIENIATWPAHGDTDKYQLYNLAPFVDVDGNNKYEPLKGDYPLIKGDQCVFFIFNDWREHTESDANRIGLEVHCMVYAFNDLQSEAVSNTVFANYKLINRLPRDLHETYVGFFNDFDVGYSKDDYIATEVSRGAVYGYNGAEIDGENDPDFPDAYGENPPAIAMTYLGGPFFDPNNEDDPSGGCDESITGLGFGDGIVDNERYGLSNSMIFFEPDMFIPEHYYNKLKSLNNHKEPFLYGGVPARIIYPGLSDPCWWGTNGIIPDAKLDWSEETINNGSPNPPGDRRIVSSMGPFTFKGNAVHIVDVAYVVARGDDGPYSSVDLMKSYIDTIRGRFLQNPDDFGNQWLGTVENLQIEKNSLKLFPNPATSEVWIDYNSNGREVICTVYDIYGRQISQQKVQPNDHFKISVDDLKKGLYVITVLDGSTLYTAKLMKE